MTSCVSTKQAQACRTDLYSVTEGPVATAACTDLAYFNLLLFPELGIGAPACTPVTVEVGPETYSLNHQSVYEQKCAWEGELSALETMECEVSELGLRGQRTYTRGDLWTGVGGFPISTVVYAEATATAAPEASESDAPGETETSTEAGESTVGDENPAPTESANPDVEESEGLAHGIAVPIQFVAFAGGAAAVLAAAIGL
ncbi:hypothetical protein M011DRAFT_469175 [Sporormia fimetaria CBS 119925]|uniref:Uncharacterized protein n=1 Tax=Sporormia fimetaria CBS 119925 TaxID=1340428 RepID=A0A6A6V5Q9_9PLEO|nr:hypothetical protein M011DRAFT_469175 [Sporormia fimetaria CBS 119925]